MYVFFRFGGLIDQRPMIFYSYAYFPLMVQWIKHQTTLLSRANMITMF